MGNASWTEADLVAIEQAIAQGTLKVEYNDRAVWYRSLSEMFQIRDLIRRALGKGKAGGRILVETSKGTC